MAGPRPRRRRVVGRQPAHDDALETDCCSGPLWPGVPVPPAARPFRPSAHAPAARVRLAGSSSSPARLTTTPISGFRALFAAVTTLLSSSPSWWASTRPDRRSGSCRHDALGWRVGCPSRCTSGTSPCSSPLSGGRRRGDGCHVRPWDSRAHPDRSDRSHLDRTTDASLARPHPDPASTAAGRAPPDAVGVTTSDCHPNRRAFAAPWRPWSPRYSCATAFGRRIPMEAQAGWPAPPPLRCVWPAPKACSS